MKIIKTGNESKGLIEVKEGISNIGKAFKKNLKRNLIVISTLVMIVGAVWLNIALFNNPNSNSVSDPDKLISADSDSKDDTTQDSYFASAQVDRSRARDEALEVLYQITDSETSTDEAVESAYASIQQIAKDIENEATIENLLKAKGFEECVAIIADGNCSIVVAIAEPSLVASQVAQIQEIVINTAKIQPASIKIISRTANT
jgi:stage III sporulation protein AH